MWGARGCDLPQAGTTAHATKQSPVLPAGGGHTGAPIPQGNPPPAHTPASAGTGTAMPPSPALSSWDTPFPVLVERGPCAALTAGWGQGRGWEQDRSILHPNTPLPSGRPLPAPRSLASPAGPVASKGRCEAHLYWGPGNGVEQENPRDQHPSHDAILDLPEAEQERHAEGHKVQPCKRDNPGSAAPRPRVTGPSGTAPALQAEPGCTGGSTAPSSCPHS